MFRSDVVFQPDRGGVLPLLKPPQSVRLASLVVIMILSHVVRLGPACIAHNTTQRSGDVNKNHRGLFRTRQPSPAHGRSWCPRTPTHTHTHLFPRYGPGGEAIINPATSTFRLVLGGATLAADEDPGGRPCTRDK